MVILFTWGFSFIASYTYKETILFYLTTLTNSTRQSYFIFTNVTELLSAYIELVVFISTQITFFMTIYQGIVFLAGGLYKFELNRLKFLLKLFFFCWLASFLIVFLLLIPISWKFFLEFQNTDSIDLFFEAKLSEYINFVINSYYLCLVSCQFLSVLFIIAINLSKNYKQTFSVRKYVYLLFIIFSTVITPPDVFSQILLSLALIGIYEVTFLIAIIFTIEEAN